MPLDTIPLTALDDAYLAGHRSRNSSPMTLEHYRDTFKDLRRFLEATGRESTVEALTAATLQTFHLWLVETPIALPWRGSTVR